MPAIDFPSISVVTSYSDVAPEEMESLITRPIEQSVATIEGVSELEARSSEGRSQVSLRFPWGSSLDTAMNDVRANVERVRGRLPEDADVPVVYKFDISATPVMYLSLEGDRPPKEMRAFAEEVVQVRLEQVTGVARVDVRGGQRREYQVELDAGKLTEMRIGPTMVIEALARENQDVPGGDVLEGGRELLVRNPGRFSGAEDIARVVVAWRNGTPVTVGDVARVRDGFEEPRSYVRANGRDGIRLAVAKQAGANTVAVAEGARRAIERLEADYPDVRLQVIVDSSTYISDSVRNVEFGVGIGAILAVLVLLFFLRDVRSTLVVAVSIPISVMATFTLMDLAGHTLNLITFGGLALGLGMLVDGAIVILENIVRCREKGLSPFEAAARGTDEVRAPVIAGTVTTLAVFVPVLFVEGFARVFFGALAMVVSFALLCALAVTLVPVLAARLPTPRPVEQQPLWARMSGALMAGIESVYGRLLSGSLAHPWLTTLIALLVLAGSIAASRGIGRELMPMGDEGVVSVSGKMPAGTPLESTLEVLRQAEDIVLAEVPELEDLLAVAGAGGWWSSAGANSFRLQLRLDDERLRSSEEVATALRAPMAQIPDLRPRIRAAEGFWLFRYLRGGGERLEVEIRGHDLEEADRLTAAVMRVMEEAEGVTDVRASREDGLPELRMTVERDKAQAMGLTSAAVRETVQTYVLGTEATRVLKDGEEYSVRVRLPESDRRRVDQLPDLPVVSPSGEVAYLGRLVRLDRQEGPLAIERKDQMRVVTVSAGFEGGSLSDVIERLRPELQAIPQADGFDVVIAGESEQQQGTFAQMGVGLLLALALVYMVMAAQFESLRHPLVIMGSVPFAGVGAVLALLLTGTTFNVYSYLGLIVLAGIVVNNAIVMVDLVNRLRRDEGMGRREALLVGARLRLRPILMTTLTTVLALLPVAIGVGEGGELQAPLARVVVGGLLVSTAVSLVLVPVLYQAVGGRIEASPDLAETLIEE
jgi:HAE1 family hydrophobic/amphiphilic exporter-1